MFSRLLITALFSTVFALGQPTLRWLPEHLRPDPFGGITPADRFAGSGEPRTTAIQLKGARGGYVSCHVLVSVPANEQYTISVKVPGLEADLFREWFHYLPAKKAWIPDALIPVAMPHAATGVDADNKVPKQTTRAYWLDVWAAKETKPGLHEGTITVKTASGESTLPIRVEILTAVVPDEDVVLPDHNSYGTQWLHSQYPANADLFALIHVHHRIFYEHRGTFHQLGYGHGGKVAPEFAPALGGSGRTRHITSWDLYDRHYGPLLNGSAFAKTRRGPKPIPFVYLPINPEWPASFLWWGEKGYEAEFSAVVREMERHFREKNWTRTNFELFFNHKKRYKAFPWDGDETRFPEDNRYFVEYARLMKSAMPKDSPVRWVFRTDTSWTMAQQFKELEGIITFWVAGGGMLSLYDWAPDLLKKRRELLWTYGGTPPVTEASAAITADLLSAWLYGSTGFVRWLAVAPGDDPWFRFSGGDTALVYPGTRFGLNEPLPSIRLKIQRNCVQDLNLLDTIRSSQNSAAVTKQYNGRSPDDWWTRNSPLLQRQPQDWNNADIGDALKEHDRVTQPLDAASWQRVRDYMLQTIGGRQ